jgi:putative membrane protein
MQTATMTAVSPKASIDSALFILRGVRLVREIALIYGMRPGILGTCSLLRRVLYGAATVATVDFAAGIAVQGLVSNAFAQKLGGDMAAAAAAWQRMFRLGQVAVSACRILPKAANPDEL